MHVYCNNNYRTQTVLNLAVRSDQMVREVKSREQDLQNLTTPCAIVLHTHVVIYNVDRCAMFTVLYTVEPLITDIPNSGHLPNNGQESMHQPYFPLLHYKTNLPRADTSLFRTMDSYVCTNKQWPM